MPIVHEDNDLDIYSDDSFSDKSEEELKARRTPTSSRPGSANRRPGSARKAPPNKPPSPYLNRSASNKSTKSRPRSADPSKRTGRELWLQSLRQGEGVRSSNYVGPVKTNAWGSCTDYLKATVLGMPPKRHSRGSTMDGPMRATKGMPAFKAQEDMYDDILDLKKSVNTLKAENDRLKARNRRLEDDHAKKERTIEQLLDPSQANLRATLSSKQPDTAQKVNNLKQKSLKLEMTVKDKEAQLAKLQNDLKTTKVEEMRVAMESFYQEVLRLRHHIKTGTTARAGNQEANQPAKVKALNGTILRLTGSNQRLQSENKLLKQDLERALDDGPLDTTQGKKRKGKKKDYEDMNRRELLVAVADLEEKVDKLEGRGQIANGRHGDVPGKVALSGSLADRLDQLDRRETEMLEEKSAMEKDAKRLKEEKSKLRQKMEDSEFEILSLQKQVDQLKEELEEANNNRKYKSRETTPRDSVRSGSLKRHSSQESVNKTITPRSGSLKRHPSQESLQSHRSSHRSQASQRSKAMSKTSSTSSMRRRQREEEEWISERDRKVEELRQNRSAKSIQKNWRAHKQRAQKEMDSSDMEDAAVTIQSAVRGHKSRKNAIDNSSENSALNSETGSDMDDAAEMIQSAVRGHWSRKDQLHRKDTESERGSERGSDRGSVRSRSRSAGSRGSRPESIKEMLNGDIHSNDSDSDEIGGGSHSVRSIRSNSSKSRPISAKRGGRESPPLENGHADSISSRHSVASHHSEASHKSVASRHSKAPSHHSEASHHSKAPSHHSEASHHSKAASHHSEASHHSKTSHRSASHRSPSPQSDESHHSTSSRRSKAASHRSKSPRSEASHHSKASNRSKAASHRSPSPHSDESHHSTSSRRSKAASHRSKSPRSEASHHSKASNRSKAASHRSPSPHSEASHHSKASNRSKPASHRSPSPRSEASHHSKASSKAASHHSKAPSHRSPSPHSEASHHSKASKKSAAPSHRSSRRSSVAEEIIEDDDVPEAVDSDSGEAF